ncbi:5c773073-8df8-4bee-afad-dc7142566297 [Thermothielavioides terrestris]|uniref:5c773073-8df8-4bee-afad-dc7142566297 n=1 Tax=Thermothielavioides terrestris TaxID=2587410 RepID=A0A446BJP1_9PEZI|nr:5c773073-8df8-4bee-afad-dc7142566297 [Thermothielavioides terrestris]
MTDSTPAATDTAAPPTSPPPATAGGSTAADAPGSTAADAPAPAPAPAPAGTGHLEADPNLPAEEPNDDADSSISALGASYTTSVMSSIYKFREENGRTYHAYKADESTYFMPNDERETERLDLQHHLSIRMLDNRLYVCPAGKDKPLKRVLDCGTGTGIWAIDFAEEHPDTAVVGVDLSPIQPNFVPPNVEFFVDDLEETWTYHTKFDFIYARFLTGSIRNWAKLARQAFENLNPGGYFEVCDPVSPIKSDDGTLKEDSAILKWNNLLLEGSRKLGASLDSALQYEQHLIDAGFQNVTKVEFKWPINGWPSDAKYKEVGEWNLVNITQALQALSLMLFTNVLGWSVVEVETLLAQVRKDLKNRATHAYWPM